MAKKRKHPGVVLLAPDERARQWWRARYVDPDSGRTVRKTLDRTLTTIAAREDHCVKLSERLGARRREIEHGAARATGTPLRAAEAPVYASLVKNRERTPAT